MPVPDPLVAMKATITRFVEQILNKRDLASIASFLTEDFAAPPGGPDELDRAAFAEVIAYYANAFSGLRYAIEELVAEGDIVAARLRMEGTHTGDYFGRAPTGRRVSVQEIDLFTLRDGLISGLRISWDEVGLHRQLEADPA